MVGRAEKIAADKRQLKTDRFVTFTDTSTSVNWAESAWLVPCPAGIQPAHQPE